jgi:hypothetical protein
MHKYNEINTLPFLMPTSLLLSMLIENKIDMLIALVSQCPVPKSISPPPKPCSSNM